MPNTTITGLATATIVDADTLVFVDASDTTMGPNGTNKKSLFSALKTFLFASPTLVTPNLGTPSAGVLTNATGLPTAGMVDGAVTLAKMANLAQDQFIGRTTASTGVPQTATITAAARTVLDDTTVAAMVDTLGGASSSGTGGLARVTGATHTTATLAGITTSTGTDVTTANALGGGTAIDVARALNTKSVAADTTFTFSGTPAANQWFGLEITTDSTARTITIPSSFSYARQTNITSFVAPANSVLLLSWRYDGTVYKLNGDPVALSNKSFNAFVPTGGNTTIYLGFSPVAGTLASCVTDCDSGTATYTVQVNGVNATGTANSVSSTKQTQSISAAVAVGDEISIVRSADSTCVNARVSVFIAPSAA
jgi:hypothetical protein